MFGIYNCGTGLGGISQDIEMGNTGFGIYYAKITAENYKQEGIFGDI